MDAPTPTTKQHTTALAQAAADEVLEVRDLLAQLVGGIKTVRDKLGERHPQYQELVSLQHKFAEALAQSHKAAATIAGIKMGGDIHTLVPLDATDLELHPLHPSHRQKEQPPKYRDRLSAAANDLTTHADVPKRSE